MDDKQIASVMKTSKHEDVVLEEDDGDYEQGDIFLSFHRQASRPISRKALSVGSLSAWLNRCVIPSRPHDGITPLVIFSAVHLVYGRSLGLSYHGLPHSEWVPGLDRSILCEDNR